MVEVLLFVNIGLLVIGAVTLTIAVFVLQKARGYVELAEERMERLREGQEQLSRLLKEQETRIQKPVREKRAAEPRVEELEKELLKLRQSQNAPMQQSIESRPDTRSGEPAKTAETLVEKAPESDEIFQNPKILNTSVEKMPEGRGTGFVVKHAHPDDDVSLQRERTPVKMFREHYHRYLENYEGYVKLVGRLCRMREDGEVPPGSPSERQWEQKLRRLNDGIQRTTSRLDILEQYNPELASDDCVTHRAEISQSYSELEKKLSNPEDS